MRKHLVGRARIDGLGHETSFFHYIRLSGPGFDGHAPRRLQQMCPSSDDRWSFAVA